LRRGGQEPGLFFSEWGSLLLETSIFLDIADLAEEGGAKFGTWLVEGGLGEEHRHLHILEHLAGAGVADGDVLLHPLTLRWRDLIVY
jgi:hypothetical protein